MYRSAPQGWFELCYNSISTVRIEQRYLSILSYTFFIFLLFTTNSNANNDRISIWNNPDFAITSQPEDTQPCESEEAYFFVEHNGEDDDVTFRWQESRDDGATWMDLEETGIYLGVRLDRLAIIETTTLFGNLYRVRLTDSSTDPPCELFSDAAKLIAPIEELNDCNNEINLSLGPTCETKITADAIIEGNIDTTRFTVILEDFSGNELPNPITSDYLCQTIIGRAIDECTGDECWGFINIENKSTPRIIAPDDITVIGCEDIGLAQFTQNRLNNSNTLRINENCNIEKIETFFSEVQGDGCPLFFIEVLWRITDDCGNEGTDTQIINIERPPIVIPTGTKDVECGSSADNGTDRACRPFLDFNQNGVFNSATDEYIGDEDSYCNYGLISRVVEFEGCADGFKKVFTNRIIDWCSDDGTLKPHPTLGEQMNPGECTIKVEDTTPPVIPCPIARRRRNSSIIVDPAISDPGSFANPFVFNTSEVNCDGTATITLTANDACKAAISFDAVDVYGQIDENILDRLDNINNYEKLLRNQYSITGSGTSAGDGMAEIHITTSACRKYFVEIRASDECGNITAAPPTQFQAFSSTTTTASRAASVNCRYFFEIQDMVDPVAVCDDDKSISFSSTCRATLPASTFDGGSVDNCALAEQPFTIARAPANGLPQDTSFKATITFTSDDLNTTECDGRNLELILRVEDAKGNFGYCSVDVELEDKIEPKCANSSMEVSCADFGFLLDNTTSIPDVAAALDNLLGATEGTDNCGESVMGIESSITITQDGACGVGTIERTFKTEDKCGNQSNLCKQTLFVRDSSSWTMRFPYDAVIDCDVSTDIPPTLTIDSILTNRGCDKWAMTVDSTIFQAEDDGCYKIVREYKLANWCRFIADTDPLEVLRDANLILEGGEQVVVESDSLDSRKSSITYRQIIKVRRAAAPELTFLHDKECDEDNDCFARQDFQIIPSNPCSKLTVFDYYLVEDADNNGTPETSYADFPDTDPYGNRSSIFTTMIVTGEYPVGTHRFVFRLEDICGNQTVRNFDFVVEDCTAPRADCIFGLEAELRAEGSTILFARQFDAASSDVCSNPVTFSFSENPADSIREFTCRDINRNIPIELHVFDRVGNRAVCSSVLIVRPNDEVGCTEGAATIAGSIRTENGNDMDDVNISLSGVSDASLTTSVDGEYTFLNVTSGGDYTITPSKEDDYRNGVTTFDLVLIRKHILGLGRLDSPYKLIAADVNRSGNVSTFDMVTLRKLILGIDDVFEANTSWRFIDKEFQFADPNNPWAESFPEVVSINNLPEGYLEANFIAIKIGDINLSATPNFANSDDRNSRLPEQFITIENQDFYKGSTINVTLKSEELKNWAGCQLAIGFDINTLQFIDYQSNIIQNDHLNLQKTDQGKLAISWVGESNSNEIIHLQFKALTNGMLQNVLHLAEANLLAEAYSTDASSIIPLGLDFIQDALPTTLQILSNTPNPFQKATKIHFYIPKDSPVTLTIRNVAGQIVFQQINTFEKGYQNWTIDGKHLATSGVLYYQLTTNTEQVAGKMVRTQ